MTANDRTPGRRGRRPAAAPRKVRRSLRIDAGESRRLDVWCAMTGDDAGAVLSRLIATHLRRFVVQDRERAELADDAPPPAG